MLPPRSLSGQTEDMAFAPGPHAVRLPSPPLTVPFPYAWLGGPVKLHEGGFTVSHKTAAQVINGFTECLQLDKTRKYIF